MKCYSTIKIRNPNGDGTFINVPCGKCMACISNRRIDWTNRLEIELKYSTSAYFITLTYDPDHIPENGNLVKKDVQDWLKRLRKKISPTKIKYYLVGEYGTTTKRPHYHALIFNLPGDMTESYRLILNSWQNGLIHVGKVTSASIAYCTKYMIQKQYEEFEVKPFSLMSKRPAIGAVYVKDAKKWHRDDKERFYMVKQDGEKARLPRYFREKVYTKLERQVYAKKMEDYYNGDENLSYDDDFDRFHSNARYLEEQKEAFSRRTLQSMKNNVKI